MLSFIKSAIFSTLFIYKIIFANNLNNLYLTGFNFSQAGNHQEAFKIMLDLAQKHHPAAMQNTALSYKYGLGIAPNINQAFFWFTKAHQAGVLDATNELANIYYDQSNIQYAEKLWQLSSNAGDKYGIYNLAMLKLEQGLKQEAYKLLKTAKQKNHPRAVMMLNKYYD